MLIVEAQNIRQYGTVADYAVTVKVNCEVIALVHITGHDRRDGWRKLLHRIADAEESPLENPDRS